MWKVKKSRRIHGTEFFASEPIKKNIDIIEYIGEKITKKGDRRSEQRIKISLNSTKTGSVYIFELNKKMT